METSNNLKIAVLLTCHNRREKTIRCLESLFSSLDYYNINHDIHIILRVFLVDDGSTDGTSKSVLDAYGNHRNIVVIKGSGKLFWAGGMRLAWNHALAENDTWNFYLLINDDTILYKECFDRLFETHNYSLNEKGKSGIYSGIICGVGNPKDITYGGIIWESKFWAKHRDLVPSGKPQMCDASNANILLIDKSVVDTIGIFYEGYSHGFADYDYSMHARKKGIPVFVTGLLCGECDYDHKTLGGRILEMNYNERREYFSNPLHSTKEYLLFFRRNLPLRYPITMMGCLLRMYFPYFYLKIQNLISK
jgi:GT2 family glycosyltransferase